MDKPQICVIDDDELVRQAVGAVLLANGYAVIEGKDGEAGLNALASDAPALIITDIMMPNRDGIETIREAKRKFPGTPILVMSGSAVTAEVDFLSLARKLGADGHIKKPFEQAALLQQVRALVAQPV